MNTAHGPPARAHTMKWKTGNIRTVKKYSFAIRLWGISIALP